MLKRMFLDHPASVDETYGEHMAFAGNASFKLFKAAFACLVHAIVPGLFERTASTIIAELYNRTHGRGAPTVASNHSGSGLGATETV